MSQKKKHDYYTFTIIRPWLIFVRVILMYVCTTFFCPGSSCRQVRFMVCANSDFWLYFIRAIDKIRRLVYNLQLFLHYFHLTFFFCVGLVERSILLSISSLLLLMCTTDRIICSGTSLSSHVLYVVWVSDDCQSIGYVVINMFLFFSFKWLLLFSSLEALIPEDL